MPDFGELVQDLCARFDVEVNGGGDIEVWCRDCDVIVDCHVWNHEAGHVCARLADLVKVAGEHTCNYGRKLRLVKS